MKCNQYETKSGKPIRLWQGDCMDLMDRDKEWDLAIVDPPYGIDINSSGRLKRYNGNNDSWDKNIPDEHFFIELMEVSDNQVVWGGNYFPFIWNYGGRGFITWDKEQPQDVSFASCELAWTSFDRSAKTFYLRPQNMDKQRIHTTQKPIKLYRWILQNYAEENDTILDTHGGSMSLAIACYIEDYELDIIELDEDYYRDAVQRFENHISQKTLF